MRHYIYYLIAVLSLSACGGGGGGSSASSSSPLVTFSQVASSSSVSVGNGISNEISYTYNVAAEKVTSLSNKKTGETGAKVVVSHDSSSNLGTLTLTTAGGTTISWNTATDTYGALIINNNIGVLTTPNYASGQNYTLFANPYRLGWDYQTFGTWVTGAGSGSGKAGNYSIGVVTTGSSIPTSGSATYTGDTGGRYANSAGTDYFTTSNLSATANYATRSISLSSTSTKVSHDLINQTTNNNLNFTGTMSYTAANNSLSGTILTTGGLNGTVKGQFYGPLANEIGGSFTATGAGIELYSGAFGAKK